MKAYGDIERVDLATRQRWQRVTGDGESHLVPYREPIADARLGPNYDIIYGPCENEPSPEEIVRIANQILKGRHMNATRCKMKLVSISGGHYNDDKSRTVTFVPVTSGSEENKKFYAATPNGKLEFQVSGEAAESLGLNQGKIGSEFYVDITPVTA